MVLDDIFQEFAKDIMEVPPWSTGIYRVLFRRNVGQSGLTTTLVPLGDGILMLRKI